MGVTVKYTCDKCGHEQPTNDQMWKVAIVVAWVGDKGGFSLAQHGHHQQLWCRACAEKLGTLPANSVMPSVYAKVTLEDAIREIVREELAGED